MIRLTGNQFRTSPNTTTHALYLISKLSSVQFKMISERSEKPIIMRSTPSLRSFPNVALENGSNVRLTDDGPLSSFQGRSSSASSFNSSLLQVIDGMMSLALCPQVVSQASQHFRPSERQAICEGCFARQSNCSVVSLHSGMSGAVPTHRMSFMLAIDTFQSV